MAVALSVRCGRGAHAAGGAREEMSGWESESGARRVEGSVGWGGLRSGWMGV